MPRSKAISHLIAVRVRSVAFVHQFAHSFVIVVAANGAFGGHRLSFGKCSHSCDPESENRSSVTVTDCVNILL